MRPNSGTIWENGSPYGDDWSAGANMGGVNGQNTIGPMQPGFPNGLWIPTGPTTSAPPANGGAVPPGAPPAQAPGGPQAANHQSAFQRALHGLGHMNIGGMMGATPQPMQRQDRMPRPVDFLPVNRPKSQQQLLAEEMQRGNV